MELHHHAETSRNVAVTDERVLMVCHGEFAE
jgi:hypothetical protein